MSKHTCHAEACSEEIPEQRLFCGKHWRMTPKPIQHWVWRTYVPGQERTKTPSPEYLEAQRAAVEAVAKAEGRREPSAFPDFQTEAGR